MSARASGADTRANGGARPRENTPGNQNRAYTVEQKAAVLRVRKCSHTAFYEILGAEKSATDSEIKKAYRKLSLLTHPDKNGYDGADEAFKMVSRAFQILSDADKKAKYDRFGGDPDSRFGGGGGGGGASGSPFEGFARSSGGGGRGPMFEEEISPEELFNRFFGGGLGGGFGGPFGGAFGGGQQYGFNMGGGPGFRVHQFGSVPRQRPRAANRGDEPPQSPMSFILQMLPVLFLFVLPLLSSLLSDGFGGDNEPKMPKVSLEKPIPPYDMRRDMPSYRVPYYVKPQDVESFTQANLKSLDRRVEKQFAINLRADCQLELQHREQMLQDAQGWFFPDADKMREARQLPLAQCRRMESLGIGYY